MLPMTLLLIKEAAVRRRGANWGQPRRRARGGMMPAWWRGGMLAGLLAGCLVFLQEGAPAESHAPSLRVAPATGAPGTHASAPIQRGPVHPRTALQGAACHDRQRPPDGAPEAEEGAHAIAALGTPFG